MNINSSNIEPGVYEDADFSRDFAAAMHKGGQLCTPPAKTESPSGLAADSALGGCSMPYVFKWEDAQVQVVEHFEEFSGLLAFARGWSDAGGVLAIDSATEFRGFRL